MRLFESLRLIFAPLPHPHDCAPIGVSPDMVGHGGDVPPMRLGSLGAGRSSSGRGGPGVG